MATTTQVITDQAIGTGSNKGQRLFPQKLTLQSTTTAFAIEVLITNGASAPFAQIKADVRIRYAMSLVSVSAASAPELFENYASYVDIVIPPGATQARARQSLYAPATGIYLYVWADSVPALTNASELDVYVRELP